MQAVRLQEAMERATTTPPPPPSPPPTCKEILGSIFTDANNLGFDTMSDHSSVQEMQQQFYKDMENLKGTMQYCNFCKERWFEGSKPGKRDGNTGIYECSTCLKTKTEGVNVRKFTDENLMDPYPELDPNATVDLPAGMHPRADIPIYTHANGTRERLPKLSMVEMMLISRVFIVQKVYRLSSGNLGYKGQVLNMEQDLSAFANPVTSLPHNPSDLPMIIVRKLIQGQAGGGDLPRYKDFKVNRHKIWLWLTWLKDHNNLYEPVTINRDAINALPEDGNIVDQLPTMEESAQLNQAISNAQPQFLAAAASVAAALNSGEQDADESDLMPQNQQQMGPEQGGASGANVDENQVEENYLPQPTEDNTVHEKQVRKALSKLLRFDWPETGTRLSDYCTPSLQAMAFPTLFPWGYKGDVTMTSRKTYVSPTDANKHLLKYAVWDQDDDLWHYPFAEHPTWCHWAQNLAERHRVNTQKSVYLKKQPQDANLTVEELTKIVQENGPEFKAILGRMNTYNSNINGSSAYLFQRRMELEALMQQEGFCTLWYSCSAAENYWHDLMVVLDPKFDFREFANEEERAKYRRKLVRDNQHIVDHVLFERFKSLFGHLFGDQCLAAAWNWYRGELQGRGCYHMHGCCKLEEDTGLPKLARIVAKGRLHQLILTAHCPEKLPDHRFPECDTDEDKWEFQPLADFDKTKLTDELIVQFQKHIEDGVKAHLKIVTLQDFLLTTHHPKPPADAASNVRSDATLFQHDSGWPHPSSISHAELNSKSKEQKNDHYCEICDAVERHKHQAYCGVTKNIVPPGGTSTEPGVITPDQAQSKCRFSYHKPLSDLSKVVVTQFYMKVRGTKQKM